MDPDDGRDLAGRHRLRHQLRHAPGAHQPHLDEVQPRAARAGGSRSSSACPPGSAARGFVQLLAQTSSGEVIEQGARWCLRARLRLAGGPGAHRGGRLHRRGRCRRRSATRRVERGLRPDRHPGLGQPLPGDPGGPAGEHLRRGAAPRPSASTCPNQVVVMFHCGSRGFGHQVATDYLQSLPARSWQRKYGIKVPRPRAGLRPLPLAGGAGLLRRHEVRHQHVLRQPPGDPAPHPRGLLRGLPRDPRGPGHAAGLRRRAQHRQAREAPGRRRRRGSCWCTARAPRAPSARAWPSCPPSTGRPASRSSSAAAWRPAPTCWPAWPSAAADLLHHGPRQRPHHEPPPGEASSSAANSSSTTGRSAASTCAPLSYARPGRGGRGRVQGHRRRGRRGASRPASAARWRASTPVGNVKG